MLGRLYIIPILALCFISGCSTTSAPLPATPSPTATIATPISPTPSATARLAPTTTAVPSPSSTPTVRPIASSVPSRQPAKQRPPATVTSLPQTVSGPLPGLLLIADKGNNRLILMDAGHRILWEFPRPGDLPPNQNFLIPDDAFLTPGNRTIIATEEDYHVVREIDIRTHRIVWQYGHPGAPGSAPGYLNGPDDAYRLPDGLTTLADIRNCRILYVDRAGHIVRQLGTTGYCVHDPPLSFGSPNGDTPLPDGGMLVSEINGSWIDRLDAHGKLVWSIQTPLAYPSDPQLLPDGNILVSDYSLPGRVAELDLRGRIIAEFGDTLGQNLLNHPSLAIRLPNGQIAMNDDWNHRVIIVNLRSQRILWQYGTTGYYGSASGYLNTPDGIDFLATSGKTSNQIH